MRPALNSDHVEGIKADASTQITSRSLSGNDVDLQHLVLSRALDPRTGRNGVLIHLVVAAVSANGQTPSIALTLLRLKRSRPAVDVNSWAAACQSFCDTDPDLEALCELRIGEAEIHEVAAVDVLPHITGELVCSAGADDVVAGLPASETGVGWVHVGGLHWGIFKVEEALR